jgi:hypothetical protein
MKRSIINFSHTLKYMRSSIRPLKKSKNIRMKPGIYKLFVLTVAISLLSACKKHEYYQRNPNNPSVATPSLLLSDILVQTFTQVYPLDPSLAARHMTYFERPNVYVNYNWSTGSFTSYDILRQVRDMEKNSEDPALTNYRALAKLMRAWHFIQLTETFGDIPYSQALQALDGNTEPVYDEQESVYAGALNELEEANNLFDASLAPILGDIIYNGDVAKWKKMTNAFRLRVLVHLSKREGSTSIDVKEQFQSILNDPGKYPLMESSDDNAQLVYNTSATNNYYPLYQNNSIPSLAALEKKFVTTLKDLQDLRLFEIAEPVTDMPAGDFNSYDGVDAGGTIAEQNDASPSASKIKNRYFDDPVNEPMILLGFAEQEFVIAEAIARGWITGDAATHYNNGITASMQFYGISQGDIDAYIAQPTVTYDSGNAIGLIILQKYISFFMNSGWEPFFEQRRTGIPVLSTGPGTDNGGLVPQRWQYPQSEYSYNQSNVSSAVQRQFGGSDDINGVMWVLE